MFGGADLIAGAAHRSQGAREVSKRRSLGLLVGVLSSAAVNSVYTMSTLASWRND